MKQINVLAHQQDVVSKYNLKLSIMHIGSLKSFMINPAGSQITMPLPVPKSIPQFIPTSIPQFMPSIMTLLIHIIGAMNILEQAIAQIGTIC